MQVYTLNDLKAGTFPASARLAVIGCPIHHSRSPRMQTAALASRGKAEISYIPVHLEAEEFESGVEVLGGLGFLGLNVTVPHKTRAFEICREPDALARSCRAVNTLVFDGVGAVPRGCNTDGPGFARAVAEVFGQPLAGRRVVLLGAGGGAGAAIAVQCAREGVSRLDLVNRTSGKLGGLMSELAGAGVVREYGFGSLAELLEADASGERTLVVNATSLGLKADDPSPVPAGLLHAGLDVFDTLTHETALQRLAAEAGARVSDGLPMLVWQGAFAFEIWFGELPDTGAMAAALA